MGSRTLKIWIVSAVMLASSAAFAQVVPDSRGSNFNERDEVTGYLCVTPACDVVRLPQSDCLCAKQNPAERRLSRLRLKCSEKRDGRWAACRVKPRYGISVN